MICQMFFSLLKTWTYSVFSINPNFKVTVTHPKKFFCIWCTKGHEQIDRVGHTVSVLAQWRRSCILSTSDYNHFFIFIVELDTDTRVNLKNIHIMYDNCSQLQVIFQSGSTKLSIILALCCFAEWCFGYLWRVEKERKGQWKLNVEIFTPFDVKML